MFVARLYPWARLLIPWLTTSILYPWARLFSTQRWFVSENRISAETCFPIRFLGTAYVSQSLPNQTFIILYPDRSDMIACKYSKMLQLVMVKFLLNHVTGTYVGVEVYHVAAIADLGVRWRWAVSFTLWLLYFRGKTLRIHSVRGWVGYSAHPDVFELIYLLSLPAVEPRPSSPSLNRLF
jgi:hypothetical protein